jgi:hypothetical protein
MPFAMFLGPNITFYEIKRKEQITQFLDRKIKTQEEDPDKKWITTWNHNLVRIKHFFRWLYNYKKIKDMMKFLKQKTIGKHLSLQK